MSEGWERRKLGSLMQRSLARLGKGPEPTILTCTENHGLVNQIEHLGRRVATEDLRAYKVVRPFDIVYNVYLLWLGSIGQNLTGAPGVTSPVYEVFTPNSSVHAPYLGLLLRSPATVTRYEAMSIGTVPRRRRAPWEAFLDLTIDLPPLPEQHRIVDLIGSLDEAIEAAEARAASLEDLVQAIAGTIGGDELPLDDLAIMRSGPSWKSEDESASQAAESDPVLSITNTRPDGSIDLTTKKYVTGLAASTMRLTPASTVMIRTNGNRNRIGNVYRANRSVEGYAVSAFQIAIEPKHARDADYIYWALAASDVQAAISSAASGSTGLGNVAIGWLKALPIRYHADTETREAFVARCEAAGDARDAARDAAGALRSLRTELLAACLSGEHEIPASYDQVMEAAA